ncbi:MAG: hypothetical protein Q8930_16185 [Bacillota bacterium]|nr:hypothetical protein [Bacillota bacterium]
MENINMPSYAHLEEIQLSIFESETAHYGGNQYWFPKKLHQLSGCGPVAAANITAYLSQAFPDRFKALYPYEGIINKKDFVEHMVEVRKYVIPGMRGLTSVHQFVENTLTFAMQRGISLVPHILDDDNASMEEAVYYISEALKIKLPVAILVLTHPVKEFDEYVWHWMTITHLRLDPKDNTYYITASTYGERHEINFDLLWNHRRRSKDIIKLAYFT